MATDDYPGKEIIDFWEEEREQLLALIFAIEQQVVPKDPDGHPREGENATAWRLCQIGYDKLSDASGINALREAMKRKAATN